MCNPLLNLALYHQLVVVQGEREGEGKMINGKLIIIDIDIISNINTTHSRGTKQKQQNHH